MKNITLTVVLILLSSCASEFAMEDLKGNDLDYINKINGSSLSFELDKTNAEKAWSRGNSFINHYSKMQIQTANEYHVATINPDDSGNGGFGYKIIRELSGDRYKFSVICYWKKLSLKYSQEICKNNEKILSYYMQTGEINEKFLDTKIVSKSKTIDDSALDEDSGTAYPTR